jgi:hypothetical protein
LTDTFYQGDLVECINDNWQPIPFPKPAKGQRFMVSEVIFRACRSGPMEGRTIQLLSLVGMPREVAYSASFFRRIETQEKDGRISASAYYSIYGETPPINPTEENRNDW